MKTPVLPPLSPRFGQENLTVLDNLERTFQVEGLTEFKKGLRWFVTA